MNVPKQSVMRQFLLVFVVILMSSSLWGKDRKLAPDLQPDDSSDLVNVIVQFKQTPGEAHKDKIRSKGGTVDSDLSLVKAVSGKVPQNRLSELADDPDVAYISPDRSLQLACRLQPVMGERCRGDSDNARLAP